MSADAILEMMVVRLQSFFSVQESRVLCGAFVSHRYDNTPFPYLPLIYAIMDNIFNDAVDRLILFFEDSVEFEQTLSVTRHSTLMSERDVASLFTQAGGQY